ncbi:MAG: ABC transporter permease subunit [Thaumarchaeota archaeon]|nr:ABC transporter permease subunit [Nitrososphaerota archaeon]MDG6932558.1 ABC transporter permease subunit [Nitrososphaerota archaeon]
MNLLLIIQLAAGATILRVLLIIVVSILTGWLLAYASIKSSIFESIYIPVISSMESVPVITFFPVVLVIFVTRIGGPLGTELASDFLVMTAVVWNIWIAQYQSFKTVPKELQEVTINHELGFFSKMRRLYMPFSMPKIAANLFPSFADGLFYITVSEVFSIGTKSFSVFGIGSLIPRLVASGDMYYVWVAMLTLAAWVAIITFVFRYIARFSVAKYGLDTAAPIRRRGKVNIMHTYQAWNTLTGPMKRLSKHFTSTFRVLPTRGSFGRRWSALSSSRKYIMIGAFLFILIALLAEIALYVVSVPIGYWGYLISYTPLILYNMAFDYARVAIITLISLVIAIFVGYYLAVHQRAAVTVFPAIQIISAFPAPVYFPLVFAATFGYMYAVFPASSEIYVLFLGFISTFYYVFYSFWMGVQTIPSEFWEIMENHELGFFTRMRRIILPATFPYLVAGLSSTIDSAWGGLMIGEYWPDIFSGKTLEVHVGLMKMLDVFTYQGRIGLAAWSSLLFAIVVTIFSLFFTKKLMTMAREKYVIEEGVYAA